MQGQLSILSINIFWTTCISLFTIYSFYIITVIAILISGWNFFGVKAFMRFNNSFLYLGIIAWHPDRLSRNEIDASTITYLVRTGVIHGLKFGSYNFDNSPEGIMMLQLALSQSQYFSSKLGKDVKRGLEKS